MPEETPVIKVVLFLSMVWIYTVGFNLSLLAAFSFVYLSRASATVSRSEKIADQRPSLRVLIAALWADCQADRDSLIFFRPLAVIDSSTRLPRPPPTVCTIPSRCKG